MFLRHTCHFCHCQCFMIIRAISWRRRHRLLCSPLIPAVDTIKFNWRECQGITVLCRSSLGKNIVLNNDVQGSFFQERLFLFDSLKFESHVSQAILFPVVFHYTWPKLDFWSRPFFQIHFPFVILGHELHTWYRFCSSLSNRTVKSSVSVLYSLSGSLWDIWFHRSWHEFKVASFFDSEVLFIF